MHHFVIVGGGTAGWMAAAALARFLPPGRSVALVESDAIGTVGVGEATIPQIRLFNQSLGIDDAELIRQTQGTIKLGIEFSGWSRHGSTYLHAFGTLGRPLGLVPFHHYWLRGRADDPASGLWDYSTAALAARANRFAPDTGRPDLPTGLAWAFQFDAALYAAFLRRHAEERGVRRVEGRVADVLRDAASGHISAVRMDDGREIAGAFFIDCTGFASLLLGQALDVPFDDWSRWLPCDRALAVPCAGAAPLTPYTRATARGAGWQWRIPLQHRTGNGLVYSSAHLADDAAADTLLANLDGAPLADPRPLRFRAGRRRQAWAGNCVALGLAAGFLEPLESTSIHLIQSGIARLLQLLPADTPAPPPLIAEFNRQTEREWQAVRDFLILHYHANDRPEPFWAERRATPLPDRLQHRIDLFRATGRIAHDPHDLFTEVAWLQVMIGQGIVPEAHHPLADGPAPADLAEFLSLARRHAAAPVGRMPDHHAFLTGLETPTA
ncbi:tryptophan halogenase family protein [Croceicoccus marinus]|nr:tryptophan halogenase family protein [Croceicoccus marinus]